MKHNFMKHFSFDLIKVAPLNGIKTNKSTILDKEFSESPRKVQKSSSFVDNLKKKNILYKKVCKTIKHHAQRITITI